MVKEVILMEKEKICRQWKATTHISLGERIHFGTGYHKTPPVENKKSLGITRVAGLAWNRLLMRVDNSTGKGMYGMDKFGSVIDRMNMKLGSKFLNSVSQDPAP